MVAAWIGCALSTAERKTLEAELLLSAGARGQQFAGIIDKRIDEYRKLLVPYVKEAKMSREHFARFAKTGRDFAAAIRALSDFDRDILVQLLFCADAAATNTFDGIQSEIDTAQRFAMAAADICDSKRKQSAHKGGRPVGGAESALIEQLAKDFARTFGVQPSASKEGLFMAALRSTWRIGHIQGSAPAEARVAALLKRVRLEAPKPRRGRPRRETA